VELKGGGGSCLLGDPVDELTGGSLVGTGGSS
jgi:hypothetical protein